MTQMKAARDEQDQYISQFNVFKGELEMKVKQGKDVNEKLRSQLEVGKD